MIRFAETMDGVLETPQGKKHAFSFDVEATAPDLASPLGLRGRVKLEGLAPDCELDAGESRLEVGPPFQRHIRYTLAWNDAEGRRYRFFGEKTVRLLNLPKTMRTLPGKIFRDGEELGRCLVKFRWLSLPSFLLSFRLLPGRGEAPAATAPPAARKTAGRPGIAAAAAVV